jgi:hypothetical protein
MRNFWGQFDETDCPVAGTSLRGYQQVFLWAVSVHCVLRVCTGNINTPSSRQPAACKHHATPSSWALITICQIHVSQETSSILLTEHVGTPSTGGGGTLFLFRLFSQSCEKRLLASSCLSVRMEKLGSQRTDFHEIWNLRIFREYVEKVLVWLKSDNNNGTLHEDLCTFMTISRWILPRIRNVSDRHCRENQNTHFIFGNFFFKSCRLWDNVEKYGTARQDTDDNIIRRMRLACWITKDTDTHWEYVILIAFTRQQCYILYAKAPLWYVIRTLLVLLNWAVGFKMYWIWRL